MEESHRKILWHGTNFKTMSIFDKNVPNGILKYFVKGNLIHQVLNLETFPNMIKTYRNDKANHVKLALSEPQFYNFLAKASFMSSQTYRLDYFLKKSSQSVEFMYCFKILNKLQGTYNLILIVKEKDKILSSVFLYDNKVEVEAEKERVKNLSKKIYSKGQSFANSYEKYAQQMYAKKKDKYEYPVLRKLFDQHIGTVVKILPYIIEETSLLFILNQKGRLYKLNVLEKEIVELSYSGDFCQNIKFMSHSNLNKILICHTQSNSLNFYFIDPLSQNSRTKSRVPTLITGLDPKLEVGEDNSRRKYGKKWVLLYTKHYRDTVFLYNLKAKINTPNVLIGDVDIEDSLKINFGNKLLSIFPPKNMNFGVSEFIVLGIKCIKDYFIQLLQSDNQNWVCFYTFKKYEKNSNFAKSRKMTNTYFKCEKCFRLPPYIKILSDSKLNIMEAIQTSPSSASSTEILTPKICLKIFNTLSNSYNNLIIDPFVPYLETLPSMMKPISSVNNYYQMEYVSIEDNFIKRSVADLYFGYQMATKPKELLLQAYEFGDLKIYLDTVKYKMLTHQNIQRGNSRLDKEVKFYFINFEKKQNIFELGGLDRSGFRIVKQKDLSKLEVTEIDPNNKEISNSSGTTKQKKPTHPFFIRKIKLVQPLPEVIFNKSELGEQFFSPHYDSYNISFNQIYKEFLKQESINSKPNSTTAPKYNSQEKLQNSLTNAQVNVLNLRIAKLIDGDIFNTDFKLETSIDSTLDNLLFQDTVQRNSIDVRTPEVSDSGLRILRICVQTKNPENLDSPCKNYKQLYHDRRNLFMLEGKLAQMKNFTNILEQKNLLSIQKLDTSCSFGVTYKTFFIRVCNHREDGSSEKNKLSDQKEIIIIDFQSTFTSYIPFKVKVTSARSLELDINVDLLVIKVIDSRIIKKVYLFQISQISEQERRLNRLQLVSKTNLKLDLVSTLNVKADDMVIINQARGQRDIFKKNGR